MKTIKHGQEEIKVTNKVYGSYSIRNNKLIIYKGYKSNIYYMTYANEVIMTGETVATLLESLDEYLNTLEGFENLLREIDNKVNKPLYKIITKDNEIISIYNLLRASDSLEMLETSEIHGGKYAIRNKENNAYAFGLSLDAAKYIFNNN